MNNYRNNITKNNIALNNTIRQLLTEMDNLNSLPRVSNVANIAFEPPQKTPPPPPEYEFINPEPGSEKSGPDGQLIWNGQKWVLKSGWNGKIWNGEKWIDYKTWYNDTSEGFWIINGKRYWRRGREPKKEEPKNDPWQ